MQSKSLFPFVAAALLAALPAFPQGGATGSLSGQVVDPEGMRGRKTNAHGFSPTIRKVGRKELLA